MTARHGAVQVLLCFTNGKRRCKEQSLPCLCTYFRELLKVLFVENWSLDRSFKRRNAYALCASRLIANVAGMKRFVVNRKTALQTTIPHAHACLNWRTLVHNWPNIEPEFRPTQALSLRCSRFVVRTLLSRKI